LPRPEHIDLAHLLLRKAQGDLAVARLVAADPDPHDDAIGFHAQQAVEKALKAVLARSQVPNPRTHDLTYLVELLGTHGIDVPATIAEPEWLSPWAVTTRYDDLDDTLDRHAAVEAADSAITWAQTLLAQTPSNSG
jgi:HEPN domain-containing protein